LLEVSRAALESAARERGLTWVDDPSNSDPELDRNYVRHELLPVIAARWPGYRQTIGRAIGHVGRAAALESHPLATVWTVTGDPGVRLADLAGLDASHIMKALRAWLAERGLPMPAQAPLVEFTRQLLCLSAQGQPRLQWGGHVLQRYREGIFLLPEPAVFTPPAPGLAVAPGAAVRIAGVGDFRLVPEREGGISLGEGESLQLAWRRGGERCRPQGYRHSRSLKKLLQDTGVPPWWRDRLPLFYRGSDLVAVADLWCCDVSTAPQSQARPGGCWRLDWRRQAAPGGGPSLQRD
jgi:tRNA(Ile)-lysidine synthase